MTHGGEDIGGKVTILPAKGPNSEYAAVTRSDTTIQNYLQRKPNIYNRGTISHAR